MHKEKPLFPRFVRTYVASAIVYQINKNQLEFLLIKNEDGTVHFPVAKEELEDAIDVLKSLQRFFSEKITPIINVTVDNFHVFFQTEKKEKNKEPHTHYFASSNVTKDIPYRNTPVSIWVPWKEIFFLDNISPAVIIGITAFLFHLKQCSRDQESKDFWKKEYSKNNDLHFFLTAVDKPTINGTIAIKNYLALDELRLSDELFKKLS